MLALPLGRRSLTAPAALARLGALVLLAAGCSSSGGGDADTDADVDVDTDTDVDADTEPRCTDDTDCELGWICNDGRCVQGCTSSRDCPSGKLCDPDLGDHGRCVTCFDDADCDGLTCFGGACVKACATDADCPPGRPLCDTRGDPPLCVGCLGVDDCPLLTLCLEGACLEGCRTSRDCPAGWSCFPDLGPQGQCQVEGGQEEINPEPEIPAEPDAVSEDEPEPEPDPDPEPDAEPDADPAPDLHEPEDLPPEIHETVDRPPMNCDESYNLSRGRGTLTAAVSGRGSDTPYRSTDVVFSWQESTADRPILIMEAKEWCRYGQLKADLMFTCLIRQEDLGSLPLEIRLTGSYIAGQNSCKASYSDRWAVYPPMSAGTSIVFEGYTARSEIRARFGASMAEATNPGNVVTFTDGSFTAIAAQ